MPYQVMGNLTILAAVFGILGAKLFHNLENFDTFLADPMGSLLSFSGLTFYGGLICGFTAAIWYARSKNIKTIHLLAAAAPGIMIAYGIGRLGCHVSGDGDWGVFNSAYKVDQKNHIVEAAEWEFHQTLMDNQEFTSALVREYGNMDSIPHIAFKGPSFLPNWFWAYNYPHNVNEVGNKIKDCEGGYCYQLTPPVFPTPLYEILACTLLFGVLWYFRKKIKAPGALFGLYLIFNGFERFMVEKIRVNTTYDLFGFHPTQAELISTMLMLFGAWMWIDANKRHNLSLKK
jgi:prolipoprotein diacylglyceryltransferase